MIDAHVHTFPALLPAGDKLRRAAARLPARRLLDIEGAHALKNRLGALHRFVEAASSLAMVPSVMLHGTPSGLLDAMDRCGATRCIVIGSRGVASNEWLLGEAQGEGGDRFIPVATMPELAAAASASAWLDAYDALARAGARGFKIHTNWDDVDAASPNIAALFEVAAKHGLFVILHTGCFHVVGYRRKEPCDLASFERWFAAFPRVRVCLAHMNRDHAEDAWDVMRRHEQVYTDTSWQPTATIARALDAVGSQRVMVGSDWPLLHKDLIGDARERAERAASGAALDDLLEDSALRLIGELS